MNESETMPHALDCFPSKMKIATRNRELCSE
jgi:hypothetical protein